MSENWNEGLPNQTCEQNSNGKNIVVVSMKKNRKKYDFNFFLYIFAFFNFSSSF